MKIDAVKIEVPEDILGHWQEICDILAGIAKIPAALIMRLTGPDLEVCVSSDSDGNPYHPGDKETFADSGLYCETVLKTQGKLHVADALADADWKQNPDIKLNMISYLGFPITMPNGQQFGTICILDSKHNEYSERTETLMLKFRSLIESHINIIFMNQVLGDKNKRLNDYLTELQALRGMIPICASCKDIQDADGNWRSVEHYLIKNPEADFSHGICPDCKTKLYPEISEAS